MPTRTVDTLLRDAILALASSVNLKESKYGVIVNDRSELLLTPTSAEEVLIQRFASWLRSPSDLREVLPREEIDYELSFVLLLFVRRMATIAVSGRLQESIQIGALAVSFDDAFYDYRDLHLSLELLLHSAKILAVDMERCSELFGYAYGGRRTDILKYIRARRRYGFQMLNYYLVDLPNGPGYIYKSSFDEMRLPWRILSE